MPRQEIKVVIDTNIWISFLIGKTLSGIETLIVNESIQILFSKELFNELIDVIQRPKFNKYFSSDSIQELISFLVYKSKFIEITDHFQDCRDSKDNFLLDLSVSGKAIYLVTGDKDLLVLNLLRVLK